MFVILSNHFVNVKCCSFNKTSLARDVFKIVFKDMRLAYYCYLLYDQHSLSYQATVSILCNNLSYLASFYDSYLYSESIISLFANNNKPRFCFPGVFIDIHSDFVSSYIQTIYLGRSEILTMTFFKSTILYN